MKIREWIRNNRFFIALSAVLTFICYFGHAMTLNVGVDTEQWIIGEYGKYWLLNGLGRFGCYYGSIFLNAGKYNPYMNGAIFLVVFDLSCVLWLLLFDMVSGFVLPRMAKLIYMILYLTSPIWAHQFYFSLQQCAIAFGLVCIALSIIVLFVSMNLYKIGGVRQNHACFIFCRCSLQCGLLAPISHS